jgi:uncharacterized protein with von Willebrand factor type A (vWA) domain
MAYSRPMSAGSDSRVQAAAVLLPGVLRLVHQMRRTGVAISSSELIDATEALRWIEPLDRRQVRDALAATLVKEAEDLGTFDLLFDLHFALRTRPVASGHDIADGTASAPREIATSLDRVTFDGDAGDGANSLLGSIMDAIRRGDPDALRALAQLAVTRLGRLDSQPGASERYFMYRILRALELSRLMTQMLAAEREDAGEGGIDERAVRAELAERIEAFKQMIAAQLRGELTELRGSDDGFRSLELIGTDEVDFLGASPRQLAAMRDAIRPLARALASKMARRRRRRDRGRLDVRRTVRRSLSSGGVLLDPAFRRPKVARPDLYLLCDVSGSVAEFASFTLTLLQAMTAEFSRMRSFAFVDGIDEVTDHLKDVASFLEVRHVLYRADVVLDDGHSDYGTALQRFWERHGQSIDSRSTIIVTGDARSNHRAPKLEILRAIHARARKVYLLNPEPERDWNTTDSIVDAYLPGFDGVFEVRNLRQLGEAIYRIT